MSAPNHLGERDSRGNVIDPDLQLPRICRNLQLNPFVFGVAMPPMLVIVCFFSPNDLDDY